MLATVYNRPQFGMQAHGENQRSRNPTRATLRSEPIERAAHLAHNLSQGGGGSQGVAGEGDRPAVRARAFREAGEVLAIARLPVAAVDEY